VKAKVRTGVGTNTLQLGQNTGYAAAVATEAAAHAIGKRQPRAWAPGLAREPTFGAGPRKEVAEGTTRPLGRQRSTTRPLGLTLTS